MYAKALLITWVAYYGEDPQVSTMVSAFGTNRDDMLERFNTALDEFRTAHDLQEVDGAYRRGSRSEFRYTTEGKTRDAIVVELVTTTGLYVDISSR